MTRPFVMPKSCRGISVGVADGAADDEVCGNIISLPEWSTDCDRDRLCSRQVLEMARFFALVLCSRSGAGRAIPIRSQTRDQQCCQDRRAEESDERRDVGPCLIEAEAHEISSQSARHAKHGPYPSKNRTIRAQAKVTARQIRNNVDLRSYTETDQHSGNARRPDCVAQPEECNPDRDRGEKQRCDTRCEKLIQQVATTYPPQEQPYAEERAGEGRELRRAAPVRQDRR